MSFLLDTDICSAYLKGNRHTANRLLLHTGGVYINTIVLGELVIWTLRSKAPPSRSRTLNEFLEDLTIVDVTPDVARKFGEVRAGLLDRGLPMPPMDSMIAATALVYDFTLVTHNTKDFANVPNLRMVDWLAP